MCWSNVLPAHFHMSGHAQAYIKREEGVERKTNAKLTPS